MVIKEGKVEDWYLADTFSNPLVCSNGMLKLIEFNANRLDPKVIEFAYDGVGSIKKDQI